METTVPGVTAADLADLEALDRAINALLPPLYRDRYDKVEPVSMGSAGLKFGADGKVAWDEIWTTFCDLALAGGPPHRGRLLMPASADEVHAEPEAYQKVTEEIGRGIWMVTWLHVLPMVSPGWIGVFCRGTTMAAWLTRAIVAENVYARHDGERLYLPAGPRYRLEKEIKNVVTALAKTNHYWSEHLTSDRRSEVAEATGNHGLIAPASPEQCEAEPGPCEQAALAIETEVHATTGLAVTPRGLPSWVGFTCGSEAKAIWLLRAVSVANVVVWREGDTLHVPVPPGGDASASMVAAALTRAHHLWNIHRAVHGG
jgi:sirohydrochlorin cobaltochelatase